jgi:hypothetical protein
MVQDDGQLVARVLAGETTAFGLLIDRYRPAALRLTSRMLGDPVDAEDVAPGGITSSVSWVGLVAESRFFWTLAVSDCG